MKNITLALDHKITLWARLHAAHCGRSLSSLVEELLQTRMHEVQRYEAAMQRHLAQKPFTFQWDGACRSIRETTHDRACLR